MMLMSHGAISASVIGLPSFGPCAETAATLSSTPVATRKALRVDMANASLLVDGPARDRVEVLARERADRRRLGSLPAPRDELGAGRLHVSALVPGAALQHGRPAIPTPRHAEARERLRQNRVLQRRLSPALAAVRRDHHLGDAARARIRDAGNLVIAGLLELIARGRMRDEPLSLLEEVEAIRFSIRQDLRIGARLVVAHRGFGGEFDPAQILDVHVAFVA